MSQARQPGVPGKVAAAVERTAANENTPGHNTTERSPAVDVAALGVLNLDVTPPLNASRSYYDANGVRGNTNMDAISMGRTPSPTRGQDSDPLPGISGQEQQYQASPSRSGRSPVVSQNTLQVERRQLVFGTAGTAGEESGGTYEAQLLGSESDAKTVQNRTPVSLRHHHETASSAIDQDEAPTGQWARFGQEMVMLIDMNTRGMLVATGCTTLRCGVIYSTVGGPTAVTPLGVQVGNISKCDDKAGRLNTDIVLYLAAVHACQSKHSGYIPLCTMAMFAGRWLLPKNCQVLRIMFLRPNVKHYQFEDVHTAVNCASYLREDPTFCRPVECSERDSVNITSAPRSNAVTPPGPLGDP